MPLVSSPALDRFNAGVDALTGNAATQKAGAKALGATLLNELELEFVAHIQAHIDAMLPSANQSDSDLLKMLQAVIAGIEAEGAPVAANLAGYLTDRGEGMWAKLTRSLFMSRDLAEANLKWDAMLALAGGSLPAAVATRYTRIRQFIESKGL